MGGIVSTEELAARAERDGWVVFDCRHDLMDTARGERAYMAGHVPGARFAPVETALSGAKTGRNGRHPLPAPEVFAAWLARQGVARGTPVVAYDDAGGLYAARLWWMARWVGVQNVALLDGGIGKWIAEGRPLTTDVPAARAVEPWTPQLAGGRLWTADEVRSRLGREESLVIDARAAERFRGDVEPMDPVAGHIPGAANRFYKDNLRADLTLRPAEELRAEFGRLLAGRRAEDVGHQCGSGITACANLFAMEYAGLTGSNLYAGSWSEWVADPTRPVARG